jgi:hypothetical protein
MSHSKTKNGYIVRLSLLNGYRASHAQPVANCHHLLPSVIRQSDPRQIESGENFSTCFCDRSFSRYKHSAAGVPRRISSLVEARDDPVLDWRELADWDGVGRLV